jgi:putative membrane protein
MEAILWTTPRALRAFGMTREVAETTRPMTIDQGVCNLSITTGLIWVFSSNDPVRSQVQIQVQAYLLSCVLVATATTGMTVSRKIMIVQGAPALLALGFVVFTH